MINVKAKSQDKFHQIHRIPERTTFKVLSRVSRGSTGLITISVPKAGKIIADGHEIKRAKVAARSEGRMTLEVELKPIAKTAVKRHGRIQAHIKLSYVPRGGHAITKTVPLIFGYQQRRSW
jgi:hypothetical protein